MADNWVEKHARTAAHNDAGAKLYTVYDIYKKSHGMASSPDPFDKGETGDVGADLKDALKGIK